MNQSGCLSGREAISIQRVPISTESAGALFLWPDLLEARRRLGRSMVPLLHGSGTVLIRVVPALEVAQRCHRISDVIVLCGVLFHWRIPSVRLGSWFA